MQPTNRFQVWLYILLLLLASLFVLQGNASSNDTLLADSADPVKIAFFENRIRPVLVEHCYECHSSSSSDIGGNLKLDDAKGLTQGGSRGPSISRIKPADSLLLKAIAYEVSDLQMPPKGKLPQSVADDFRAWIEQGALDPRTEAAPVVSAWGVREQAAKLHWAFQPLALVRETDLLDSKSRIDTLLSIQQTEKQVYPNPPAAKRNLIRRLYHDLIGLQPTWEQYQAWEKEPIENYELWVTQLLESPHFGERMARRWMDVSRYADTKGYVFQEDREYANAWRFRDWLIRSFNNDLPFDQFASLQIAADRLAAGPEKKDLDAMGFLTLGRRFLNDENDIADDRIDVITRGFMGLSVACARCHDHKFDAVGMADYYSMHAALVSSKEPKDEPGPLRLVDSEKIRPAVIFKRGQAGQRGDQVPKRFVGFLSSVARPMETGSGRLEMAMAIADRNNPLTPRVFVNRIWGWFLGTPLVDTPSDFGMRCPPPQQRELLDRLAADFVADGFDVKRLIKRIVMSTTYQRSSDHDPESFAEDPENLLWWRGNRKRLDFESLRDSVLVATQVIDPAIGGASIKLIDPPFSNRRTLYAYIDRQNLPGVFRSFDFASPDSHVPNRLSTTVPQQGLFFMNSPMVDHYATELAKKTSQSVVASSVSESENASEQLRSIVITLFHSVLLREPTPSEMTQSIAYVRSENNGTSDLASYAWPDLIKALLCTNEFCFID